MFTVRLPRLLTHSRVRRAHTRNQHRINELQDCYLLPAIRRAAIRVAAQQREQLSNAELEHVCLGVDSINTKLGLMLAIMQFGCKQTREQRDYIDALIVRVARDMERDAWLVHRVVEQARRSSSSSDEI